MARDTGYTESDGSEDPIDLSAVRRDDRLVETLIHGGSIRPSSADEAALASLLSQWRSEIVDAPLPPAPDLDAIVAVLAEARDDRPDAAPTHERRRRSSLLRPAFGAAAAIAFVVGGVAAVSYNAVPGDPLWEVKEVVFAEQAQSTVARVDTTDALEDAEQLISSGSPAEAKQRLDQAAERVAAVSDAGQRQDLIDWWNRLQAALTAAPGIAVPPPVPAPITPGAPTPTPPGPTSTPPQVTAVLPPLPIDVPTELPTFTLPTPTLQFAVPTEINGIPIPPLLGQTSTPPTS